MKVKRFHQFVRVEKGPINAAVIDLLKGNAYQVENKVVTAMEKGNYTEITEFLESAEAEGLIIEIDEKNWIPYLEVDTDDKDDEEEFGIELHIEEGVNLEAVLEKFSDQPIYRVVYYGQSLPLVPEKQVQIVKKEKDFQECITKACVDGEFSRITEPTYLYNMKFNSCWGGNVAITTDGKIRPCIHSTVVVGDISIDDMEAILEKMEKYWSLTKDKVEKCKDCELRYICFDCRELARRQGGDLFAPHPTCEYDPYKGTWKEKNIDKKVQKETQK